MKYLTIALFLGVISAKHVLKTQKKPSLKQFLLKFKKAKLANMVHISLSKEGQAAIEKEVGDLKDTYEAVKWSKPVRNMENSLERFERSAEVKAIEQLDKEFLATDEGKKLFYEWQDFFEGMEDHIQTTEHGWHIDHDGMQVIDDEVEDIKYEYEELEKTEWPGKYDKAFETAWNSKTGKSTQRRFKKLEPSPEFQALEKELKDIHDAVEKNLKIVEASNLLKIELSKAGQAAIEKEVGDLKDKWEEHKWSKPVRNMENSLERWERSPEVKELEDLDKAFLATDEGKKLYLEWQDFFEGMEDHIQTTEHGWHIDHDGMQVIEDEVEDIKHEYKDLEGGEWHQKYQAAWDKATSSKTAGSVKRRFEKLEPSKEFQELEKELKDIHDAIDKNLKVTENMYLF